MGEEPKEGRVAAVMRAEAAEEEAVGDEAAPKLADERGAWQRGRHWGEAEKDLTENVLVLQQGRRHRRAGAAALGHRCVRRRFGNSDLEVTSLGFRLSRRGDAIASEICY